MSQYGTMKSSDFDMRFHSKFFRFIANAETRTGLSSETAPVQLQVCWLASTKLAAGDQKASKGFLSCALGFFALSVVSLKH
jgi:hypothetical protein